MALELERFDLASAALDALGSIDVQFGRYGQTLPIIEQRLKVAQLIKNPWEIGDIHAMAAWTYAYTVDYRRAAEIALEGFEANQSETRGVRLHNLNWAAYAEYFGQTVEALVGQPFVLLVHPDDRERVTQDIASLGAPRPVITTESGSLDRTGSIRWAHWICRALCDVDGRVVEVQAVGRDITDRRRAEQALAQSTRDLAARAHQQGGTASAGGDAGPASGSGASLRCAASKPAVVCSRNGSFALSRK